MTPYYEQGDLTIYNSDCLEALRQMPDESANCCVTSPPYWGLRDYGVDGQIGLEETPDQYVAKMVAVFREVRRVLRDDGTLWLNLGDTYAGYHGNKNAAYCNAPSNKGGYFENQRASTVGLSGLKNKDLIGIPWRVAFALQADGWYLRQDIIWCLSGGAWVYARTQKGDMPVMVKDLVRLNPATVKLWNGEKWTQVLGWSKSQRKGDELELVLRSGERLSCTPTHKFPTQRGLLEAKDLRIGDRLQRVRLPEPEKPKDCAIDLRAAWFAGLYIAEGSRSGDCIQIAGHAKEEERWRRVQEFATHYGGSATRTVDGNMMNIRVYGKVINAIVDLLVTGRTAKDKGFAPVVWQYSDNFIYEMLHGYLSGDGHWDDANHRWRLGFTRNYNLERDLRTACARLDYRIVLNLSSVSYNGKDVPTFRGEIRYSSGNHHNCKDAGEIVEIRKSRCREVYDIGVEDDPHVFALASGILTHNSKPNPMPESVTDRCTKAHEYIFLLAKSERYYYDAKAIAEPVAVSTVERLSQPTLAQQEGSWRVPGKTNGAMKAVGPRFGGQKYGDSDDPKHATKSGNVYPIPGPDARRNRRSVWTVTTQPYSGAHFATYPPKLIEPCIKAGCPAGGVVLDPFFGAGTTGLVARQLGCKCIGIELNPKYCDIAVTRLAQGVLPFAAANLEGKP